MKGIWNAYNTEIFGFIHETKGLISLICINIPHHLIQKPAWHLWCFDITLLTYVFYTCVFAKTAGGRIDTIQFQFAEE